MSEIAITVENISKLYHIGRKASGSFRETVTNSVTGLFSRSAKDEVDETEFWALKDISFQVKQGDVVGIVGKNGAGKSTLLKILSRITEPTTGRIQINGRVGSLLEVGTGFHPELSGRENIFLNGSILGMRRYEIQKRFDEIVEFSGIEKFIDTPVKRYSSGMYVRLAFAVAAHLEPEILIIDEVLAVGDAEFQKKCLGKMKDVSEQGRTIIFVSHNMTAVRNLCNRGVLIAKGQVEKIGSAVDIISKYENLFLEGENRLSFQNKNESTENTLIRSARIVIDNSSLPSVPENRIDCFSKIKVIFTIQILEKRSGLSVGYYLFRNDEHLFTSFDSDTDLTKLGLNRFGLYELEVSLPYPLKGGNYQMTFFVGFLNGSALDLHEKELAFRVEELSFDPAFVSMAEKRNGLLPVLNQWKETKLT